MTDIMVDLETGGTRPGCVIYSIGACVMQKDRIHAPQHQFYQNVTQRAARGFHTDQNTLDWWAQQSPKARAVLEHDQIPIKSALVAFHAWAAQYPEPRRFWACGPHFDYSIYAEACRLTDTPVAFKFWLVRDTRTALDVACVSKKDADKAIPADVREKLVKHHALSDCIEQTYHVWYAQDAAALRRRTGVFLTCTVASIIISVLLAILCFVVE